MKSLPGRRKLVCIACCVITWVARVAAAADTPLTYTTPGHISFVVSADGLSSIRSPDRVIATGSWTLFNAEKWFKDAGAVAAGAPAQKSVEILAPDHARVRQRGGDVSCVYDYTFLGEDLLISARIENNHAGAPLNVRGFSGLRFIFDQPPEGLMPVQHISYFQANRLSLCHPSGWCPIGGSYATDRTVGVGSSPWNTGMARTLILWDYADWATGKREALPERKLVYFANIPVPARGAATIDFKLRVSGNRDWKHLLKPYRDHFQKTFGLVRYKTDARWIATDYLNKSQEAISPQNPYGFHGGHRRIDTPAGAKLFCDTLIPRLKEADGQGAIVWGQGGEDPRGAMYRPDFDILPPEVEANWPVIATRFHDAGLKLGVAARPRHLAIRQDWKQDEIVDINPADPAHRQMLWRRFDHMLHKGCTLFYLDSFGDSFEDLVLMRDLRDHLGPDVLTFAEHQCDAMLVYSGGYSETTFTPPGKYRLWSGMQNWEIYRYLAPGCQMAARLYEVHGKLADADPSPDRFFLRHQITPLVPVDHFDRVGQIKLLQGEMLDATGAWKQ